MQYFKQALLHKKSYLYKAALNYYSCFKASELSFAELFADLAKFIDDEKRRWKICLRCKRGLIDTGQKGGLYKDKVLLNRYILKVQ